MNRSINLEKGSNFLFLFLFFFSINLFFIGNVNAQNGYITDAEGERIGAKVVNQAELEAQIDYLLSTIQNLPVSNIVKFKDEFYQGILEFSTEETFVENALLRGFNFARERAQNEGRYDRVQAKEIYRDTKEYLIQ